MHLKHIEWAQEPEQPLFLSRKTVQLCLQCSSDSDFLLGLSTSSCPTSISTIFSFSLQDSKALILKLRSKENLYSEPEKGGHARKADKGRAGMELRPRWSKM